MQATRQTAATLLGERPVVFERDLAGWAIAGLNLLAALNSTYFFLGSLRSGVVGWLMMNSCAPSILLFVIGFVARSPLVMVAAALMMFRYGTLGLFIFRWDGYNIIAQIGHLLMTVGVIYVGVRVVRARAWRALALGAALGAAILVAYAIAQGAWFTTHPDMIEALFEGTLVPEG
jgi:hypothetical protein